MVEEQTGVEAEVAAQEEAIPQAVETQADDGQEVKDQDRNWQKARQLIEQQRVELERERQQRQRYEQEIAKFAKQQSQEPEEELSKSDLLTVEQADKRMEKKFVEFLKKHEDSRAEEAMRSKHEDYDAVVTADTLARVKDVDPDLVDAIKALPLMKYQTKLAYYLGKAYGISNGDKQTLAKNQAKPRSVNSVAPSPLTQATAFANGLTPELREALRKEMIDSSKRS